MICNGPVCVFKSSALKFLFAFCSLFMIAVPPAARGQADERGIWDLWTKHKAADTNHLDIIQACEEYNKTHTGDPFIKVTETLVAWHLMKIKRYQDADKLLEKNLNKTTSKLGEGADLIASAWLSRIDIMRVRAVLQFYYRKEVEYPESLEVLANYSQLPKDVSFPMKDRWGKPWSYKLVGYKTIPNALNQKYSIRCSVLGLDSDLEETLGRPYGDRIKVKPLRPQKGSRPGLEFFEVAVGGEKEEDSAGSSVPKGAETVIYGLGTKKNNLLLCYIGKNILVFCDRDHWEIVGKPR